VSTFDGSRSLSSSSCRTSLPVFAVPPQSDSVSSMRPREEWVAYSFERFIAAIKTRYTPHPDDNMYSPTRQPAKRCREPDAFAAADRAGGRARRVRGDRHGEATVIPYDAAGASARACGSVEGSTARRGGGAPTAPLPHHSRTTPTWEWCTSYENRRGCAFRMRSGAVHKWEWCSGGPPPAPLPCAVI